MRAVLKVAVLVVPGIITVEVEKKPFARPAVDIADEDAPA